MNLVVLKGGVSKERDVSLRTGAAIEKALLALGHQVRALDPKEEALDSLLANRPDAVFLALHGHGGEDGSIQGFLESLKIPFTGSGVHASAICFDKLATKLILSEYKIPSPEFVFYRKSDDWALFFENWKLEFPVIVKPSREGSTFGIQVVKEKSQLKNSVDYALQFCSDILIERLIEGPEVTVGLLNGEALPLVEIAPKSGFFDYESKYTAGQTEYFVPARIADDLTLKIQNYAAKAYEILGCRGQSRIDFMIDQKGNPYLLEVNTIPGMTETSLLPKAAKCVGIDFQTLCQKILDSAFS